MGFLSDVADKFKSAGSSVAGLYKKGFSLYKTDQGKLGLLVGCQLAGGGPLCGAAAQYALVDQAGNLTPKGAKLLGQANKAPPAAAPGAAGSTDYVPLLLVGGGVLLVILAAAGGRRGGGS